MDARRQSIEAVIHLYDVRHFAQPDQGHDLRATEWRLELKVVGASEESLDR